MEQHRHNVAQPKIGPLLRLVAPHPALLCPAVEGSHEHAKAHVAGNRQQRPGGSYGKAVAQDIAYVLKGGKAERNEHSVNYSVEAVVEIHIVPRPPLQHGKFGSFLYHRHHREGKD